MTHLSPLCDKGCIDVNLPHPLFYDVFRFLQYMGDDLAGFYDLGNFEFALDETHILDERRHIGHIVEAEYRFPSLKKGNGDNIKLHAAFAFE